MSCEINLKGEEMREPLRKLTQHVRGFQQMIPRERERERERRCLKTIKSLARLHPLFATLCASSMLLSVSVLSICEYRLPRGAHLGLPREKLKAGQTWIFAREKLQTNLVTKNYSKHCQGAKNQFAQPKCFRCHSSVEF